jgi:hypothetical protein
LNGKLILSNKKFVDENLTNKKYQFEHDNNLLDIRNAFYWKNDFIFNTLNQMRVRRVQFKY